MKENLGGHIWRNINIVPFKNSLNTTSILNIIATIPIGVFLPLILTGKTKKRKILLIALFSGLLLESLQLLQLLVIGYSFRIVDINDVMFNCIGVIVGYLFFLGFAKSIVKLSIKFQEESNFLAKYFIQRT